MNSDVVENEISFIFFILVIDQFDSTFLHFNAVLYRLKHFQGIIFFVMFLLLLCFHLI
jgi:hypothetical protein